MLNISIKLDISTTLTLQVTSSNNNHLIDISTTLQLH